MEDYSKEIERLIDMSGCFESQETTTLEKAQDFTKSVIPEKIRDYEDRPPFGYCLAKICIWAISNYNVPLAIEAYKKAFELAPNIQEVEILTRMVGENTIYGEKALQNRFEKLVENEKIAQNKKPN